MTAEEKAGEKLVVVEETAAIEKHRRITGLVRATTKIHEEPVSIDVPLITEHVTIERIAMDCWVDHPVPVRQEGDTTVISVVEEAAVVTKRLKLVEEVRIRKQQATKSEHQSVVLRRQDVIVERTAEPNGATS